VQVGTGYTKVHIKQTSEEYGEVLRVRAGDFTGELSSGFGEINEGLGGMPSLEWEAAQKLQEKLNARKW
jgi:hypothetical protein